MPVVQSGDLVPLLVPKTRDFSFAEHLEVPDIRPFLEFFAPGNLWFRPPPVA